VVLNNLDVAWRCGLQAVEEQIKGELAMQLQDCEYGSIDGTTVVSWKNSERTSFDAKRFEAEHPALYQKYKDRGFKVLAFPANNFMGQEPGSNEEIKNFCELTYKTTFPLFAKISVKGSDIHPLYKYLTEESSFKGPISWNFNKFLVDQEGRVVARYGSPVDPLAEELVEKLEILLAGVADRP
jgi:glutathione peroxidase